MSAPSRPPGWYPDGAHTARWWDGGRWTEYRAERIGSSDLAPRPAHPIQVLGWCFLAVTAVLVMLLGFSVMGDKDNSGRIGFTRDRDDMPMIVIVACPGERLRELRVRAGPDERLIWALSGDAELPESLRFGDTPPGTRVDHPLLKMPTTDQVIWISISTDQGFADDGIDLADAGTVLGGRRSYESVEAFRAATQREAPCVRREHDPLDSAFSRWVGAAALITAGTGLAMVALGSWLRRRQERHEPGSP